MRHHRDHDADRQALVARPGREGDRRRDEGGVPRRPHRPLRPRPRRRAARRPGGRARLQLSRDRRPARLAAAAQGAPAPDPRGGEADRARREARPLRRRRHDQRRRVRRAAHARRGRRPAGDHDPDGQGRVPGDAPAVLRLAGHARDEVVEHRHEHLRRARRDRRALRRPRHRQALRLRARARRSSTSTSTRPRSRSCATPTSPSSARSRRRWPSSTTEVGKHRDDGVPPPEAWIHKIEEWRDEFPLRYGTRRRLAASRRS